MFWPLILSHFIADYPLQTNKMVEMKKTIPGRAIHVSVHLVTLVVLFFFVLQLDVRSLWVYVVVLTLSVLVLTTL